MTTKLQKTCQACGEPRGSKDPANFCGYCHKAGARKDNARRIANLRQTIYDCYGYLGGASHEEVAIKGIRHGGKAAQAGRDILNLLAA